MMSKFPSNTTKPFTRYLDVRFTEAAARRGGLGERVTLAAFLACLLLHSDGVALGLMERVPVDGYADRLVRRHAIQITLQTPKYAGALCAAAQTHHALSASQSKGYRTEMGAKMLVLRALTLFVAYGDSPIKSSSQDG